MFTRKALIYNARYVIIMFVATNYAIVFFLLSNIMTLTHVFVFILMIKRVIFLMNWWDLDYSITFVESSTAVLAGVERWLLHYVMQLQDILFLTIKKTFHLIPRVHWWTSRKRRFSCTQNDTQWRCLGGQDWATSKKCLVTFWSDYDLKPRQFFFFDELGSHRRIFSFGLLRVSPSCFVEVRFELSQKLAGVSPQCVCLKLRIIEVTNILL